MNDVTIDRVKGFLHIKGNLQGGVVNKSDETL